MGNLIIGIILVLAIVMVFMWAMSHMIWILLGVVLGVLGKIGWDRAAAYVH